MQREQHVFKRQNELRPRQCPVDALLSVEALAGLRCRRAVLRTYVRRSSASAFRTADEVYGGTVLSWGINVNDYRWLCALAAPRDAGRRAHHDRMGLERCPRPTRHRLVRCIGHDLDGAAVDIRSLAARSEEHTSELQSQSNLVCRLLLEKKKKETNLPLSGSSRR